VTVPNQTDTERPAAVYRLYDEAGTLLYIGSAYDPEKRCKRHRDKPWWPQVARRKDEWHEGRSPAYLAEMKAIAAEDPRFNDFGTPGYRTPQTPAVLKRAETMLACGRAQRLAWKAWRRVRNEALADGVPRDEAWEAGEKARFAVIEASGLFPHWIERRREHGTL
jgi:predicted GIY-YIG superfamily endonuclease